MSKKPKLFNKTYQKEWSEKYKYKHIHTGEYCTFEAYVAEYIVLRRAEKLNLGKPSYKFWTKGDPNHWIWKKQFGAAKQLKEKYSEEAVLKAIQSKEFESLLVIGIQNGRGYKINPLAEKVVALYHKKIQDEQSLESKNVAKNVDIVEEVNDVRIRRKLNVLHNKTSINQLRKL